MARIRSIKPEFFKHLELQELECANPGQNIMLVYAGLWTQCDKNGVFFYNAKVIKNEILPYIDFDMQKTLDILEKQGYFVKYNSENREYGFIPNFAKYQFCSANEKKCPAKYPLPPESTSESVLEHVQEQYEDVPSNDTEHHTEPEGLQDKGLQDFSGSDEPPDKITTSKLKPDKPKKPPLCGSEPENGMERVKTAYPLSFPTACAVDHEIIPLSQPPPKKSKSLELSPGQMALFHAAKACFEASEKSKAMMYQDRETTAREMKHLKTLVVRCVNMAPGITADFLRNVLEHFRVMTNGKLKGRATFTPRALITPWIWELVIDSLPESGVTPELMESIRGMFK